MPSQRFHVESWDGIVALCEQLGTATIESNSIDWASTSCFTADRSAFMHALRYVAHAASSWGVG